MLRFSKITVAKDWIKSSNFWVFNVNNVVASKLIEMKNNSKSLFENLDEDKRPLVLILPEMSGYVKTFKNKDGVQDKKKNNELMSFCIDDVSSYKSIKTFGLRSNTCKILN